MDIIVVVFVASRLVVTIASHEYNQLCKNI